MLNSKMSSKHLGINPYLEMGWNLNQISRLSKISPIKTQQQYTPDRKIIEKEYSVTKSKSNLHDKVDSILKHNSHLLAENNKLVELIRDKENQLIAHENRIDCIEAELYTAKNGLKTLQVERNKVIIDFKEQQGIKDSEISQILTHNEMLKSKLTSLQSQHKIQIISLKDALMRQTQSKMESLKRLQFSQTQQYQTQLKKLKDTIENNNRQFEGRLHSCSITEKQLCQEIRILTSDVKYTVNMKDLQLHDAKINHEILLSEIKSEMIHKHEKQISEYEIQVKRLKKDTADKSLQNNRLLFQLQNIKDNNNQQYEDMRKQKVKSQIERQESELKNRETLLLQKQKLTTLAKSEMQNLHECQNNYLKVLQSQNNKLLQINKIKSEQISTLQSRIPLQKQSNQRQIQSLETLVSNLQQKLYSIQRHNQQQQQLLKVKICQMHQSDISSLITSYQNQIVSLSQKVSRLQELNRQTKQKLHKQLEQKTQLRKHYEIEISKIHHKNIQLKLRLQTKGVEIKQNSQIIISKHNLLSEGLLMEVDTNRKDIYKKEEDVKKLQQLVISKDAQIQALNQQILLLRSNYEHDIEEKNRQIQNVSTTNRELEISRKKQKELYQWDITKKQELHKQQKKLLEQELGNLQAVTYRDLMKELEEVQKQKIRLETLLSRQTKQKQGQIKASNTNKQMVQILKLESSSALEIMRSNANQKLSLQQMRRCQFYNVQIQSKSKQVQQLKCRLLEKNEDLQEMQLKQIQLEQRLQTLMDMIKSRTELQNRVINLGMDNNLVKNRAQLFKL